MLRRSPGYSMTSTGSDPFRRYMTQVSSLASRNRDDRWWVGADPGPSLPAEIAALGSEAGEASAASPPPTAALSGGRAGFSTEAGATASVDRDGSRISGTGGGRSAVCFAYRARNMPMTSTAAAAISYAVFCLHKKRQKSALAGHATYL